MVDIDPLTGLPKELLAMEEIIREQQSIKVNIEKRRYGKLVTIVDGIGKSVDISDLAKQLNETYTSIAASLFKAIGEKDPVAIEKLYLAMSELKEAWETVK